MWTRLKFNTERARQLHCIDSRVFCFYPVRLGRFFVLTGAGLPRSLRGLV